MAGKCVAATCTDADFGDKNTNCCTAAPLCSSAAGMPAKSTQLARPVSAVATNDRGDCYKAVDADPETWSWMTSRESTLGQAQTLSFSADAVRSPGAASSTLARLR